MKILIQVAPFNRHSQCTGLPSTNITHLSLCDKCVKFIETHSQLPKSKHLYETTCFDSNISRWVLSMSIHANRAKFQTIQIPRKNHAIRANSKRSGSLEKKQNLKQVRTDGTQPSIKQWMVASWFQDCDYRTSRSFLCPYILLVNSCMWFTSSVRQLSMPSGAFSKLFGSPSGKSVPETTLSQNLPNGAD